MRFYVGAIQSALDNPGVDEDDSKLMIVSVVFHHQ